VSAAKLSDRVVAVLAQYAGVEFVGALGADRGGVDRACLADRTEKLVQKQAPHGLRRP
jgi:hypothetical protein